MLSLPLADHLLYVVPFKGKDKDNTSSSSRKVSIALITTTIIVVLYPSPESIMHYIILSSAVKTAACIPIIRMGTSKTLLTSGCTIYGSEMESKTWLNPNPKQRLNQVSEVEKCCRSGKGLGMSSTNSKEVTLHSVENALSDLLSTVSTSITSNTEGRPSIETMTAQWEFKKFNLLVRMTI